MIKVEINVVDDILKSRIALHEFGKPVQKVLHDELLKVNSPTLFLLNLSRVNPMDYEFVIISFTEIVNESKNNSNVYLVFKIESGEFEELCTGLIDILHLTIEKGQSEIDILKQNGFSMIYINEAGHTNYLTNFSDEQMSILAEIESNDNIDSMKIQSKFSLTPEDTSAVLNQFVENKFVIRIEGNKYKSVKSFI